MAKIPSSSLSVLRWRNHDWKTYTQKRKTTDRQSAQTWTWWVEGCWRLFGKLFSPELLCRNFSMSERNVNKRTGCCAFISHILVVCRYFGRCGGGLHIFSGYLFGWTVECFDKLLSEMKMQLSSWGETSCRDFRQWSFLHSFFRTGVLLSVFFCFGFWIFGNIQIYFLGVFFVANDVSIFFMAFYFLLGDKI